MIPAWYRSGYQPGTDSVTSVNSSKEFIAALLFIDGILVCKIPLLARRTRPMQPVGQARRATIG